MPVVLLGWVSNFRSLLLQLGATTVVLWAWPAHGQQRIEAEPRKTWEVLEHCRLIPKGAHDGDSFHVRHGDREYIFRLYFVDAPEVDGEFRERVAEQAAYFGIGTNSVGALGQAAAVFSADRLKDEFTVITRWQNAQGRGKLARFYAIVFVNGKNHAAELVANGFARIHGMKAAWPDGQRASLFQHELKNRELTAAEARQGGWNRELYPSVSAKAVAAKSEAADQLVDLNDATMEDLEGLPGVGKILAQRIIAHRPYRTVADLLAVRGFGGKLFGKLEPLITVRTAAGTSASKVRNVQAATDTSQSR